MALSGNPVITLFIADDHALFVDALTIALHQAEAGSPFRVIGSASNGEELLERLRASVPDILLLDLNMPVMNGLQVLPVIRESYPGLRVIIVTKYSDPKFVRECIQIHSVAGYVLKTSPFSEFLEAIQGVARGQLYMSSNLQLYPKESIVSNEASFDETFLARYNLTRREIEILSQIAQAKSNADIAENLFISPQTVGAHRKNIMRKLNISTTAGLVRFAIENQLG
jgi:DNA-binding NarL/FixJ family response regulator